MCLKNVTKYMGDGAKYCLPPPPSPSMNYDNIHERIYDRYLLSGDIKNEIIQLYKPKLLNI